jgi:oligopeptide/dipeptide ABC transporter ATP-binding protein
MNALLDVRSLVRLFEARATSLSRVRRVVRAVDGVDLVVRERESVGVCGESGSGKTTLAYLIVGLLRPTSGALLFRSRSAADSLGTGGAIDLARMSRRAWRPVRREIQIVFQNPEASLNPRRTVEASMADPLLIQRLETRRSSRARVTELLALVGLDARVAGRFPSVLSAGQRQRVVIARALACGPRFLVCDEPVSALDASTQAEILGLLADLRAECSLTVLLIAHDLAVLRNMTDRVAVMHRGRLVEQAATDDLFLRPRHPYSEQLLLAIPRLGGVPTAPAVQPADLRTDLGDELGCRYRGACRFADEVCGREDPRPQDLGPDHLVVCRRADDFVLSSPVMR